MQVLGDPFCLARVEMSNGFINQAIKLDKSECVCYIVKRVHL